MTAEVKCPTCGKKVLWTGAAKWRPFCSERCRLIDLGRWAGEEYAVPGDEMPSGHPEDRPPHHQH
ncbi:MAG TPA: DNA gyrase inhibitor YacG [Gammaproteobacteria bacterium]|nr:DNA gyrase inhibitor YacG [Gammaproteobacteria bacterium]